MMENRIEEQGARIEDRGVRNGIAGLTRSSILNPRSSKGFTLVEMIMVIVITGIIGGIVAVFLKAPVQQYVDVARRADMTDIADTALRRVGRDLRQALPNSVRVSDDGKFIEFLPIKGGGRYRTGMGGNELDFSSSTDDRFEVLAAAGQGVGVASGDSIVVYNLGIAGADAYEGSSRKAATAFGSNLTEVVFDPAGSQFSFDSPGHRFHVISKPVTYVCSPVAGGTGGTLTRYWGYAIQATQPSNTAVAPLSTANNALLATHVSSCKFSYEAFVVAQRSGLVTMTLGITEEDETVTLYSAVHVSNQP